MSALYSTHSLPHTHADVAIYAKAYSQLRLRGLRQSPDSFSSTYEDEQRLPADQQIARLQFAKRHIIIAAVVSPSLDLCERQWVGSVTPIGPLTWEEYLAPFAGHDFGLSPSNGKTLDGCLTSNKTSSGQRSYWHMTALYVDGNHRRQGLAKQLCEAAFGTIKQQELYNSHELRIIIKPENVGVVRMYEILGFISSPFRATLAEAVTASGEADVDTKTIASDPKYTRRSGLIMIKHV